jgi:predicted RNA-binding Zn ribbon-like protein
MATYASEITPAPFDLCGAHPALDFVNTLDRRFDPAGSKELLTDYDALLRFAGEAALLNLPQARALARTVSAAAANRVLRSARELREALAAVLHAAAQQRTPAAADVELLEQRFREAEPPRQLQWVTTDSGGRPALRWQWRADQVKAAGFPVWLVAQAASHLMLSDALERVRACEADSCRWLFLDTSKNHTRRWCNMKVCGNRAKARRFQERRTG